MHNWTFNFVDGEMSPASMLAWSASRLFLPEAPQIAEKTQPAVIEILVPDSGRDWTVQDQDITIVFSEPVTSTGTGWSCTVNGVSQTFTYVSGSGTNLLIFTIGALIHKSDVIALTYVDTGDTVSVTGSVEITTLTGVPMNEQLTKRLRFILCDSMDVAVASQAVKAAALEYAGGTVTEDTWMFRTDKATVTTEANGQFDMQYTGVAPVGGYAYVAVVEIPTTAAGGVAESMVVRDTVV